MRSKDRRPLLETYRERRLKRWERLNQLHIAATYDVMRRRREEAARK